MIDQITVAQLLLDAQTLVVHEGGLKLKSINQINQSINRSIGHLPYLATVLVDRAHARLLERRVRVLLVRLRADALALRARHLGKIINQIK